MKATKDEVNAIINRIKAKGEKIKKQTEKEFEKAFLHDPKNIERVKNFVSQYKTLDEELRKGIFDSDVTEEQVWDELKRKLEYPEIIIKGSAELKDEVLLTLAEVSSLRQVIDKVDPISKGEKEV